MSRPDKASSALSASLASLTKDAKEAKETRRAHEAKQTCEDKKKNKDNNRKASKKSKSGDTANTAVIELNNDERKKALNAPKRIKKIEELIAKLESDMTPLDEDLMQSSVSRKKADELYVICDMIIIILPLPLIFLQNILSKTIQFFRLQVNFNHPFSSSFRSP